MVLKTHTRKFGETIHIPFERVRAITELNFTDYFTEKKKEKLKHKRKLLKTTILARGRVRIILAQSLDHCFSF